MSDDARPDEPFAADPPAAGERTYVVLLRDGTRHHVTCANVDNTLRFVTFTDADKRPVLIVQHAEIVRIDEVEDDSPSP